MYDSQTLVDCYAVPGADHIIDAIHPNTGLTIAFSRTEAEVLAANPGAIRMPITQHCAEKAARQRTPITWEPSTHAQYHEMLNVLPPAGWIRAAFLVGEPMDHDAGSGEPRFTAYDHRGATDDDGYLVASRPLTIAEFRIEARR